MLEDYCGLSIASLKKASLKPFFQLHWYAVMLSLLQKHITQIYEIPRKQVVFYGLVFIIILTLLYMIGSELSYRFGFSFSEEYIADVIKSGGAWSWLVYILLIAGMTLGPLPSSIIVLVGGYIFHPLLVLPLTLAGETIGATGNFIVGRKVGRTLLLKYSRKLQRMFNTYGEHIHAQNIFFLSMIPVGTSNVTGYLAGMSHVPYKRYIVAWLSGVGFVSLFISLLGYSARQDNYILSAIIIVVGLVIFFCLKKIFRKNKKDA